MSINVRMLWRAIIKPFYRQYAALFTFGVFIMFFSVGRANEAGLLEYHLALMKGILRNHGFLTLVLAAWVLYALNCQQYIRRVLGAREYRFLSLFAQLNTGRVFQLMLLTQSMLLLPVLVYAIILVSIGFRIEQSESSVVIIVFLLLACAAGAARLLYLLRHTGKKEFSGRWRMGGFNKRVSYWSFFTRYILSERKLLFAGIKLYSAGTLYFILAKANFSDYSDLQLVYLFYSFGLLGHGVLIHQLRAMEDERLRFYRGLSVSLGKRWLQYALLYFVIFIPEIFIIARNAVTFKSTFGAFTMAFFGYSLLLLMNSLLFIKNFKMAEWLKIVTGIFFLVYIAVLTGFVGLFSVVVFFVAVTVFLTGYYQYE